MNDQATEQKKVVKTVAEQLQTPALEEHLLVKRREEHLSWDSYLIFVTGTTGGACVKISCQV